MGVNDTFHQRQPDAYAFTGTGQAAIDLVEAIEDLIDLILWYSHTLVGD